MSVLSETRSTPRHRLACLAAVVVVIVLGLASRRYGAIFPVGLAKYPGDALYALMMFFLWGVARPWASARQLAVLAILTSFAIEFSQLYKAPWIEAIRAYPLGHLVLGSGFSARDLIAYVIGGTVGWAWECACSSVSTVLSRAMRKSPSSPGRH